MPRRGTRGKTKKMMKGGMADAPMKAYKKGGKVRGAGCATKGTRKAKVY